MVRQEEDPVGLPAIRLSRSSLAMGAETRPMDRERRGREEEPVRIFTAEIQSAVLSGRDECRAPTMAGLPCSLVAPGVSIRSREERAGEESRVPSGTSEE